MSRTCVSAAESSSLQRRVAGLLAALLLVARGELRDPNFADSVVLVMNNLGPAPIGLVVNRPTEISVARLFPGLKNLASLHDKVYFGGPADLESVWFLFRAAKAPEHAIQAIAGRPSACR